VGRVGGTSVNRDTERAIEGTVSRSLPGDLSAVRQARDVVQRVLAGWRAEEIYDDVVLVASELVANALRHGLQLDPPPDPGVETGEPEQTESGRPTGPRIPAPSSPADRERYRVQISLVSTGSHVICAVTDPSEVPPVRQPVDPFAGSGRGLQLVESLSLCWGWTLLDADSEVKAIQGKSVWAIFPLRLARPVRVVGAA
jgi:hypothetical protein